MHDKSSSNPAPRTRAKRKRRTSLTKRLVLASVSFALALGLAEVALRILVEPELRRSAIYDSVLGWRGRPYATGLYVRRDADIRTRFQYNNLGYRDEDVVRRTPNIHETRVMLLGDSFLENLEVDYKYVFHKRLQDQLTLDCQQKFSAIAIGSQGYSTAQQLLAFRRYAETVSPDIVLTMFYTGNDFEDNTRRRFAYLGPDGSVVLPHNEESALQHGWRTVQRSLYERSYLVYLAKNQIQRFVQVDLQDPSKATQGDDSDKYEITSALLQKVDDEVRAFGSRHGVVIIPSRDEILSGDLTRVNLIRDFCRARAIPCLSLAEHLTAEHFFENDIHFTVQGHNEVTSRLADFLKAEFKTIVCSDLDTSDLAAFK
ncbi:MAG: hypothetical protein KDB27_24895 [Planctomycetales bacterium]|nr:hypothetical protein [Planctomycetales bacterium]